MDHVVVADPDEPPVVLIGRDVTLGEAFVLVGAVPTFKMHLPARLGHW
jgi:hypothetical protein